MEKKELLSIPQSALTALCVAYDKHVGVYPDPYLLGKKFLTFYRNEIEKLARAENDVKWIGQLTSLECEQEERSIKRRCVPGQKVLIISEDIAKDVSDALKNFIIHIDSDRECLGFDFKEDRYSDEISNVLHKFESGLHLPPCRMSEVYRK